jgi:hypothetical protein
MCVCEDASIEETGFCGAKEPSVFA